MMLGRMLETGGTLASCFHDHFADLDWQFFLASEPDFAPAIDKLLSDKLEAVSKQPFGTAALSREKGKGLDGQEEKTSPLTVQDHGDSRDRERGPRFSHEITTGQ